MSKVQQWHYRKLLAELRDARRLMVESYGTQAHNTYKTMYRTVQDEIKALTVVETVSA